MKAGRWIGMGKYGHLGGNAPPPIPPSPCPAARRSFLRANPAWSFDLDRPEWWNWELSFGDHVLERMEQRGISELELRAALERGRDVLPARREGRWLVRTHFRKRVWVVVLEPDEVDRVTHVITVFFGDLR
jgi:hypothetical protein